MKNSHRGEKRTRFQSKISLTAIQKNKSSVTHYRKKLMKRSSWSFYECIESMGIFMGSQCGNYSPQSFVIWPPAVRLTQSKSPRQSENSVSHWLMSDQQATSRKHRVYKDIKRGEKAANQCVLTGRDD